jgi:hypothetical protein
MEESSVGAWRSCKINENDDDAQACILVSLTQVKLVEERAKSHDAFRLLGSKTSFVLFNSRENRVLGSERV